MANLVKWGTPGSAQTGLATELNSLANNTLSSQGTEYDNATNKNMFADVEVYLGSLTPTAGGFVALYVAIALDGTNYPDAKREYHQQLICTVGLDTATGAKRTAIKGLQIPPFKFKLYLDNQAGVSLASSGNTVKFWPYNPEIQ